jgi:hypothetical protein
MTPWQAFDITLDHLVVATPSLGAGNEWLEERLGVTLQAGGQHLGWGTHNRLLQLGPDTYLELIAPDPSQPPPAGPRPFGLDRADLRARLNSQPRLVHFVMRTEHLDAARSVLGYDPGAITPMSRGTLRWRITLPASGEPAGDGLLPTLIQWDVDMATQHPARVLEDRGVRLERLSVTAPDSVRPLLAGIDRDPRITLAEGASGALAMTLATPRGPVTID